MSSTLDASSHLSKYHPDRPDPVIPPFDVANIPDEEIDHPSGNLELLPKSPNEKRMVYPPLILGCSTFGYGIYADDDNVKSSIPLRVVRLAMRCGMNAFDTSPWYHPSEIVLGNALRALSYPRGSYHLITKVGKYGPNSRDHHFDPETVTKSVEKSLKRMGTDYLDVVYLHDLEYILPPPSHIGNPLLSLPSILSSDLSSPTPEETILLNAIATLRTLQKEGKIIHVGIAGYPLPVLLRIALLAKQSTGKGLDVVQSYGHQTIQNDSLSAGYLDALTNEAGVGQVVSAAPLSMGILTTHGGPAWHPGRAYDKLWQATRSAVKLCQEEGTTLEDVSLTYGYRPIYQTQTTNGGIGQKKRVPIVVGCTDLDQLHSTLQKWGKLNNERFVDQEKDAKSKEVEGKVAKLFEDQGVRGWSWACPSDEQRSG
ncbi:galactose dehydrogenase [Kwoniella heveanensis BCC8398]|uniref:Galactose dehydrogenase n=1 Tax=Kwoniella heveanensis BCC8398 TaxID=1296120 RepID=A0A1B9GM55_9TREE|nr:galactose dehydrogenase [Kwoniella heveanensis BCC8398]